MNPYQSPETNVSAVKPMLCSGTVTPAMRNYLKGASGWMRFLGIVGFISCGFMVLAGGFMALLPALFMRMHEFDAEELIADLPGALGAMSGFIYIALAALTFFPAFFLYKAGARIRDYMRTDADSDLEEALRNNRIFWKFLGIITIISMALIPVTIIGGIVAVVSAAAFM
jgi:hypothetical protein